MQHLAHVTTRCYGLATWSTPPPPVNPTYCQNRDIDLPTTTLLQCSPRNDSLLRTVPATQYLVHVTDYTSIATTSSRNDSLLRASNHDSTIPTKCQNRDIDLPATDFSFPQRLDWPQLPATTVQLHPTPRPISAYQHQTSSCISTTRPTPATLVERPTANIYNATIPANDVTHPSWRLHTTATDIYIHVCNSGNKIVTFVVSIDLHSVSLHCFWPCTLKSFAESTRLSVPQQIDKLSNLYEI